MSLAENLLNSLDEASYQMRIAGSVQEEHIKVGQDRVITVPNVLKTIAVKGDKDIETATIDCVRYWDGHDLSTFAIYLNYILPNGDEGTYIPQGISKAEDTFSFDWLIGSEFTYAQGKLTFWIVAKLTDDSGTLIKQWSSFQNSDCTIAQGGDKIYVPEKQTDQDVISQAISFSRESAERAEQQANIATEAAEKAATDAREAAEAEVERLVGELGVVQGLGTSPTSVVSQATTTALYNRIAKRITNIEKGLTPDPFFTDDSVAYQKIVPENALPYAEVSKIGGMSYRDTATNTLKDAKVTEVKSIGVNMIPYPFAFSSNTVSGVTFKANSDGSISISGTASTNASKTIKRITDLPNGTYYLTGTKGGVSVYLQFWNGGTWVKEVWVNGPFTVDYSNYNAIDVVVYVASGTSVNTTIYPMINPGSTALPFAPYKSDTRAIPSEVQALEGYGLGVDATYCNHISWSEDGSKKTYHKKVFKRVFAGTESGWSRTTTSSGASRFQYYNTTNKPLSADVTTASPLVCSHLPTKSANDTWFDQDGASMQGEMFYVKDSKYTTLDEWKAFLVEQNANGTPFTIVYAVATPTETDISNLITSDNMLEVEGGGIIVAENENKMGAATTVTYQLRRI